jgi:hypothetical protein
VAKLPGGPTRRRSWLSTPSLCPLSHPFTQATYAGHAVANLFRQMSPPLKPLRGIWEPGGPARGALVSRLEFTGDTVSYVTTTSQRGGWAVEQDRLRRMVRDIAWRRGR